MNEKKQLSSAGFLLGLTHRRASALLQHRLRNYDITSEQWSVLFHVVHDEGMIQKTIAELTFKDKPTITRILNQLEQKGYIVRKADEQDRRSYRIYSTEQGKRLMDETEPLEQSAVEDMRLCLGEQRYDELVKSLIQLSDYISNMKLDEERE